MSIPTIVTAAEIAALERALASGVLEVTIDSGGVRHTTKYQTTADLLKALAYARAAYADGQGGALKQPSSTLAVFVRD